jgi:hypothetical protein
MSISGVSKRAGAEDVWPHGFQAQRRAGAIPGATGKAAAAAVGSITKEEALLPPALQASLASRGLTRNPGIVKVRPEPGASRREPIDRVAGVDLQTETHFTTDWRKRLWTKLDGSKPGRLAQSRRAS